MPRTHLERRSTRPTQAASQCRVVLLWQPSDCTDLFVIDYIFCYSRKINKYDDDDDDDHLMSRRKFKKYTLCIQHEPNY